MHHEPQQQVAVLVLNWNGRALLEQFLPSWVEHTRGVAELIIVDNGSTDDSLPFLHQHYPEVRVLSFDTNYGFAEGYNRAIHELDYPIIVLLNSDAGLSSGWLDEPLRLLTEHPDVAAIQPTIRAYHEPQRYEYAGAAGGYIDALGYPFCRGRMLDTVELDEGQYNTPVEIFWASGACLIVRRSVYLEVGGLDPHFFAHQEEIDLCWRMNARGHKVMHAPSSLVYHVGGGSLSMESPRKVYLNFRNNLLMLYKNLPSRKLYLVLLLRIFLDTLASLLYLVKLRPRHALSVIEAWRSFLIVRGQYESVRRESIRLTSTPPSPDILKPYSLLWHYYVRRERTYNALPR